MNSLLSKTRFTTLRHQLPDGAPATMPLLEEFLVKLTMYTAHNEAHYMAGDVMWLLRLITLNPARIHNSMQEFRDAEGGAVPGDNMWEPTIHRALILRMGTRSAMGRFLTAHFPAGHAIWRFVRLVKPGENWA